MRNRISVFSKYFAKQQIGGTTSINDLREREFNGGYLTGEEKVALSNFDKFRLSELNHQESDAAFHKKYQELQVMANMHAYDEFLKKKYSSF